MKTQDAVIKRMVNWAWAMRFTSVSSLVVFLLSRLFVLVTENQDEPTIAMLRTTFGILMAIASPISGYLITDLWVNYDKRRGYFKRQYLRDLEKRKQKQVEEGQENRATKEMRRAFWHIENVHKFYRYPNKLLIKLRRPIALETLALIPDIMVNGMKCGSQEDRFTEKEESGITILVINLESVLLQNPRTLRFELVSTLFAEPREIDNPYYVCDRWLQQAEIKWQCEGHAAERVIYVKPDELDDGPWLPGTGTFMYFDLLVNQRLLGSFIGIWEAGKKRWRIPIESVRKQDCLYKTAVLRITHLQGLKRVLPSPIIMSRNYVPIKGVL